MNQNPAQIARDNINKQLIACAWVIQQKKHIHLKIVTVLLSGNSKRILFVDDKLVGITAATYKRNRTP